jgi:23S rRNA (adenine2503-C2)-methyltransferase
MTASMGLKRNLKGYEIVEQFLALRDRVPTISHVVFMGMGEPLENMDAVLEAIAILHDRRGADVSHRRITVSTCGIADKIIRLGESGIPVNLAVSLVSADEEIRKTLMPVTRAHPLADLKAALMAYHALSNRQITLEYVLMKGVNVAPSHVYLLEEFTRGLDALVNVIPLNPGSSVPFDAPSEDEVRVFMETCRQSRIRVTRRLRRGRGVNAACGQLVIS